MNKQGLVFINTIILASSSFIMRAIGMLTIIYLSHKIGAEGIGVYQIVMSVYMSGVVFASSGFAVTISRLIFEEIAAKTYRNISKIMITCLSLSLLLSITVAVVLFTNASFITTHLMRSSWI